MSRSIRILCVTRNSDDPWLAAADLYLQRLRHSRLPVELLRLKEGRDAEQLSRVRKDTLLVALDEGGIGMSTVHLNDYLTRHQHRDVDFVIGAADGLSDAVRQRADLLLSLSPMTLPHRAALALLAEQLYRCDSMQRGTPYHRG